ncbi:ZIP family metal transporter [Metamycoplasma equirhinis]|uniref:ZIP family metal transporter n=1 Tax=Metamycoplasma equirhinis TaxID=92402 RepID=UPI003593FAF2
MFIKESLIDNLYLRIFANLIIYVLIILAVPVLLQLFLSIFKTKISDKKSIYLYAFSTGMFLMIGSIGFMQEAFLNLRWIHSLGISEFQYNAWLALIIGSSSLLGLIIVILGRYIFVKISKKTNIHIHNDHSEHGHSDHLISIKDIDNPKAAWMAIIMLMSHRIIDGVFLGYGVFALTYSSTDYKAIIPLLITFNIHIILEVIIVYYRQIQYGQKKWKAILYNLLTIALIIPFMFLGAFLGKEIRDSRWILPVLYALAGSIIIFMAVFELIPEFIHVRNQNPKTLYMTFAIFAAAIVITIIILSFHGHIA